MVQILVKTPDSTKNFPEWAIVEIQGELESSSGKSLAGEFVGHLFYTSKGMPIFIIGHHILYGKIVTLETPIAVLKRNRIYSECSDDVKEHTKLQSEDKTINDDDLNTSSALSEEKTTNDSDLNKTLDLCEGKTAEGSDLNKISTTEYIVSAVVKKKILFRSRPKPIVASMSKSKK